MKTSHLVKIMPLSVFALAAAPLSAAAPQQTFAQLAQPLEHSPMMAIPHDLNDDGGVIIPRVGEKFAADMKECNNPEIVKQVESIDCAVLTAAAGSAKALSSFMLLGMYAQQLDQLQLAKSKWLASAKPEYGDAIRSVFDAQIAQNTARLKQTAKDLRPAPIYAELTVVPGKEEAFDALYRAITERMSAKATSPKGEKLGLKFIEVEGGAGLEIPRAALFCKKGVDSLHLDAETMELLKEGSIYLITKKNKGSIFLTLCSTPAEADALNARPKVETGAVMPDMLGAAWLAPTLFQTCIKVIQQYESKDQTDVLSEVFEKLTAADEANAPVFAAAAASAKKLNSVWSSPAPEVQRPTTLVAWQGKDEVNFTFTCDAMGLHFEPGELRSVTLAEAPGTILYAEGTAISAPPAEGKSEVSLSSCLDIAKGITLTMREEKQDALAPHLQLAETFLPNLSALGEAAQTVFSGLNAPYSLVMSCEQAAPNPVLPPSVAAAQAIPAVAFAAGVKNRAALAEGWQKLLVAVQQGAEKVGISPAFIASLPIVPRPAGQNGAMNYMLFLPLVAGLEPQLTVSDNSFVLGSNTGLNSKLAGLEATAATPFRGVAAMLNFAPLAQMVREYEADSPTAVTIGDKSLADAISEKIFSLFATLVDHDGTLVGRWTIRLNP